MRQGTAGRTAGTAGSDVGVGGRLLEQTAAGGLSTQGDVGERGAGGRGAGEGCVASRACCGQPKRTTPMLQALCAVCNLGATPPRCTALQTCTVVYISRLHCCCCSSRTSHQCECFRDDPPPATAAWSLHCATFHHNMGAAASLLLRRDYPTPARRHGPTSMASKILACCVGSASRSNITSPAVTALTGEAGTHTRGAAARALRRRKVGGRR